MANLTMFDTVTVSQFPVGADAYGAYVDGSWVTWDAVKARFPHARILSIAVTAAGDAEALDVESGDATPSQAPAWVKRQQARGIHKPVIYTSASNLNEVMHALGLAGIARSQVRLWSAHYGCGKHICGPGSCGYIGPDGHTVPACDGTQWTDQSMGRNLDESVLLADFFATPAPPKPPVEATMPGIWKQILSVTPELTGWTVVGIGEDGDLWTTTKTGASWSKPVRIDTVEIRP